MRCLICGENPSFSKLLYEKPVAGLVDTINCKNKSIPHSINFCNNCSTLFYPKTDASSCELDKLYKLHPPTPRETSFYNSYYAWFSKFTKSFIDKKNVIKICEIGSNNGELFNYLKVDYPDSTFIGIEPSEELIKCGKKNVGDNGFWYSSYFNSKLSSKIKDISGKLDMIIARHVFEHVPEPKNFLECIGDLLCDDGIAIIESPSLELILKNKRYENISYQHLHHLSCSAFNNLLKIFNLNLIHHKFVQTDGGSNIFVFSKKRTKKLFKFKKINQDKIETLFEAEFQKRKAICNKFFSSNDKIYGYGAGAKGQHLIHMFELGEKLYKVIDNTLSFKNCFIPSTNIEIILPESINIDGLGIMNLAPTHYDVIKEKSKNCKTFFDIINISKNNII